MNKAWVCRIFFLIQLNFLPNVSAEFCHLESHPFYPTLTSYVYQSPEKVIKRFYFLFANHLDPMDKSNLLALLAQDQPWPKDHESWAKEFSQSHSNLLRKIKEDLNAILQLSESFSSWAWALEDYSKEFEILQGRRQFLQLAKNHQTLLRWSNDDVNNIALLVGDKAAYVQDQRLDLRQKIDFVPIDCADCINQGRVLTLQLGRSYRQIEFLQKQLWQVGASMRQQAEQMLKKYSQLAEQIDKSASTQQLQNLNMAVELFAKDEEKITEENVKKFHASLVEAIKLTKAFQELNVKRDEVMAQNLLKIESDHIVITLGGSHAGLINHLQKTCVP